jgi:hypothetical protein
MQKITSTNFKPCEVIPLQWVRTLSEGANKPMLIRGIDQNRQQTGDFVLKYRNAERMNETTCRRELLAAWMAIEMDIAVPEPVIIEVDSNFVATVPRELQPIMTSKALGLNIGSRYISGNATFQPAPTLPPELHQTAARIFAFDLMLQNADRRDEKPNSFLAEGKIYVYDHELSFGFLSMLPMFANQTPWVMNETDVSSAKNHLFYPALSQISSVNWEAALSTLSHLNPVFWQRAAELMPNEWVDAQEMTRIQAHIDAIQQYSSVFISEICNKLIG